MNEDWTHDLWFTRPTLCHWAIEAYVYTWWKLCFERCSVPWHKNVQGTHGFEPWTYRTAADCSTTELYPHFLITNVHFYVFETFNVRAALLQMHAESSIVLGLHYSLNNTYRWSNICHVIVYVCVGIFSCTLKCTFCLILYNKTSFICWKQQF